MKRGDDAGEIDVRGVTIEPKGDDRLQLAIEIDNPSNRTVHAYSTLRKAQYDADTGRLELDLFDDVTDRPRLGTFVLPRFTAIDPGSHGTVRLELPRVLHRMRQGEGEVTPKIDAIPLDNVAEVEVRLAWSDTPFYSDQRDQSKPIVHQLGDWRLGVTETVVPVKPARKGGR
jgi:hypothetical protein